MTTNKDAARIKELEHALKMAYHALRTFSSHEAFGGDAPEFNHGGVGYRAIHATKNALLGRNT